ncbi:hypothetical protein Tcan_05826 [Toxocara canis]|uniref:Uncharacterized protein n=1 Tax=Toxocara canis TaxID=6265 RepID=A0A0B2UUQ5_TOXCA|nr:hypothetical protein Tcan_05826 [Toxocara canis]
MHQPLRSQSFKQHRRPTLEARHHPLETVSQERRKSSPNVSRRCSLMPRSRMDTPRTDVWPERKMTSGAEERFLKLPDSEDYTRVRQFKIDEKGAVVSRGDSFRRKRMHNKVSESSSPSCALSPNETDSPREEYQSRSTSLSSNNDSVKEQHEPPSTSHGSYKIYVLGATGTGKSALISQFITSEYRNPFATEVDSFENTVSVNIGGQESELTFYEADPQNVNGLLGGLFVAKEYRCGSEGECHLDAKNMALTFGFVHYEISVALNHDVDDLLVGLIAEIKESINPERYHADIEDEEVTDTDKSKAQDHSDFKAAIRRFSQRKKKQMGVEVEVDTNKCTHFKPSSLIGRFRNWRISLPKFTY